MAATQRLDQGQDIVSRDYAMHMGDQANQLYATRQDGKLYLITLYQGGGFVVTLVG